MLLLMSIGLGRTARMGRDGLCVTLCTNDMVIIIIIILLLLLLLLFLSFFLSLLFFLFFFIHYHSFLPSPLPSSRKKMEWKESSENVFPQMANPSSGESGKWMILIVLKNKLKI